MTQPAPMAAAHNPDSGWRQKRTGTSLPPAFHVSVSKTVSK
jgi:hypothetical protein